MEDAFVIVIVLVVVAGAVGGIWAAARNRDAYGDVGGGPLAMDRATAGHGAATGGGIPPTPAQAEAEREAEIRQLLEARNARRVARGREPVDVDAELARLLAADGPASGQDRATADPALAAEVRDLVIARNARRARAGKPPLDVEAEVARRLRDLG